MPYVENFPTFRSNILQKSRDMISAGVFFCVFFDPKDLRWRRDVSPQRRVIFFYILHCVLSQKIEFFISYGSGDLEEPTAQLCIEPFEFTFKFPMGVTRFRSLAATKSPERIYDRPWQFLSEPFPIHYSSINVQFVRFEVFTAVTMKNGVFWDVTQCGSCKNRRFGGT
jgi:hypothetical protein